MFIHDTHMPQRLAPDMYTSPGHLERELDTMFQPGWHCIGALTDLPGDGDYFTRRLFDRPLICWRTGGQVHTFLNVCTHRFSLLRHQPRGHMGCRLKCQYHGWEYDANGDTQKIPDATSFRPMAKGELGLRKFRTETVGQLIFVTLNDEAVSLREFLGEYLYAMCQRWFSPDHRLTLPLDILHECNWKVIVENVLEGYHVAQVHSTSLVMYPEEERCQHEFHDVWDLYTENYATGGRFLWQEKMVSKVAGVEPDFIWKHLCRYPNVVFGQMGLFTWVQMLLPVSPSECHAMWRIFHYPGRPGRLRTRIMNRVLRSWGSKFMKQLVAEDEAIYPAIHQGIAAPMRPRGGLISTREERIFAFQDYVLKTTGAKEFVTKNQDIEDRKPQAVTSVSD